VVHAAALGISTKVALCGDLATADAAVEASASAASVMLGLVILLQ
jgi:hypothetical protein